MVSITLVNGRQISFDGRLLRLMMDIRERNHKKDKHYILVVDGDLGVGKSTFAQQFAAVIDDTFCDTASQKIHNAVEAYVQAIIKCDQFNSQILDEGLNGANARRAMSSLNILLQSVLTEIRQKNLLLVICVPFIFDLDRSIAIGLSDGLVHCYEKGDDNRRYFKFYGKKSKKALYLNPNNKKYYMYKGRCTFYGRFSNGYVMDEAEYRKFKKDSLQKYLTKDLRQTMTPEEMVKKREGEIYALLQEKGKIGAMDLHRWGIANRETARKRINEHTLSNSSVTVTYIEPPEDEGKVDI